MEILLKNFAYLNKKEIDELVKITTKPEIMKFIASGDLYTKKDIIAFITDEKKQEKLNSYIRQYWTYAVMHDNKVIGMFVFYKIPFQKQIPHINYIDKEAERYFKRIKSQTKPKTKKRKTCDLFICYRILIDTEYQGKGLGFKILKISKQILTRDIFPPSFKCNINLLAYVDEKNLPSVKLQEKVGYKLIGTFFDKNKNIMFNLYHWKVK